VIFGVFSVGQQRPEFEYNGVRHGGRVKRLIDSVWKLLVGVGAVGVMAAIPSVAAAQSAQGLLDKMLAVESKRAKGVDNYAMDVTTMGHESTLYYERVSVRGPNGKPMETFRLVSFAEMQSRQQAGQGMSPEDWAAYSDATRETGAAVSGEMDEGMNEAGLPPGMRDAIGSGAEAEPWASPNPSTMLGSMADFGEAAGKASAEAKADARAHETDKSMALFRKRAKIVGKESVGKRRAIHVRADKLNITEKSDPLDRRGEACAPQVANGGGRERRKERARDLHRAARPRLPYRAGQQALHALPKPHAHARGAQPGAAEANGGRAETAR
jgi:hypothetical protein